MKITQAARDFGNPRETSGEIAQAILDVAAGDATIAQRIWDQPTPDEEARIIDAAFAASDEDELFWGGPIMRQGGRYIDPRYSARDQAESEAWAARALAKEPPGRRARVAAQFRRRGILR